MCVRLNVVYLDTANSIAFDLLVSYFSAKRSGLINFKAL